MSLRVLAVVLPIGIALASCGGESMKVRKGEPQTAREKMLAEQKANPEKDDAGPPSKRYGGGWRYQGDRKDCFFLVGRKCYKTENSACQAAHCKAPTKCTSEGGGPVTIKCEKPE
jgi:hypothetical protein